MSAVRLYHNPACSKSRAALDLLRARGIEPEVVEYLTIGWDRPTLGRLAKRVGGVRVLLRPSEPEAARLLAEEADDDAIVAAMIADPALVERPVVEAGVQAVIGRPADRITALLDRLRLA